MERSVPCPRCDRMFKDEHGLKQHLADFHNEGKRPRAPEIYPLDFADMEGEYEPRQFAVGAREDDF